MFTENEQFYLQILVDDLPLPEYPYQGERFVEGLIGRNFKLRISKTQRSRRAVAVLSVDGLSIMDGKLAKADGSGYLLEADETSIDIPGWRLNDKEVAAFVFASLPEAYASQMGKPTNIGVIGAKFFYELLPEPRPHETVYPALPPSMPAAGVIPASISVPGAAPRQTASAALAPGIGTGFGKRQSHSIVTVHFERDQATAQTLVLRYDTAANLEARGIILEGRSDRVLKANPFPGDSGCTPPPGWLGA